MPSEAQAQAHEVAGQQFSCRLWRRSTELFLALNLVLYGVPLVLSTVLTGEEAWGVPEWTGPRRVPRLGGFGEDHLSHGCARLDVHGFVRSAPEAYTSLLFATAAIAVLLIAAEHGFGAEAGDAPLPGTPTLALVLALLARGVAGFLSHASARVDFEVAERASHWPTAVVLVGLYEQRLLVAPVARAWMARGVWLAGVVGAAAGFVLLQALGDAADGVRTQAWPDDLLRIGVPVLLSVIPALLLARLILECVQCVPYHTRRARLLPLLVASAFLFCALFFSDSETFALFDGECEVDGRPVPGWRRTRGWSHAAYALGIFAAWWWVFFEETQPGLPDHARLLRREDESAALDAYYGALPPLKGLSETPGRGQGEVSSGT